MENWQPIESAPKDGSRVLLAFDGTKNRVHIGHYLDSQTVEYGKVVRTTSEWFCGFARYGEVPEPTHWMPLPDAPALVEALQCSEG